MVVAFSLNAVHFTVRKSPAMIAKEIVAHLLAYNLVRGLMARATAARQAIARAISFKGSLQLLLVFQQQLRRIGKKSSALMSIALPFKNSFARSFISIL